MVKEITNILKILAKHLKRLSKASLEAFIVALCRIEAPPGSTQIKMVRLEGKSPAEIADIIINSYTVRYGPAKVRQALKNISQNQIRIDLEKELRGAPRTDGGQVSAVDQKQKVGEEKGSNPLKSQRPGEDTKPKGESETRETPEKKAQTSGGAADRKRKREEQSDEDVKPERTRKQPTTESESTKMSPVKAQTSGGAAGRKRERKEQSDKDVKPKRTRKQPETDKKHFITENRNNLIKLVTHVDPVLDDLLDEELLTQEQYDIIRKKETNQNRMRELYSFVISWGPKDMDEFLKILKKHNGVPIKNLVEKSKQKK